MDELLKLQEHLEKGSAAGVYHHVPSLLSTLSKCAALYRTAVDSRADGQEDSRQHSGMYGGAEEQSLDMGGYQQEHADPYRLQVSVMEKSELMRFLYDSDDRVGRC